MEQEGRASLGASLVRILTVERGGVVPRPEEVERLMDEDPDFSYLAQNWPAERFPLQPRIGAGANSLDELRDEIERL